MRSNEQAHIISTNNYIPITPCIQVEKKINVFLIGFCYKLCWLIFLKKIMCEYLLLLSAEVP